MFLSPWCLMIFCQECLKTISTKFLYEGESFVFRWMRQGGSGEMEQGGVFWLPSSQCLGLVWTTNLFAPFRPGILKLEWAEGSPGGLVNTNKLVTIAVFLVHLDWTGPESLCFQQVLEWHSCCRSRDHTLRTTGLEQYPELWGSSWKIFNLISCSRLCNSRRFFPPPWLWPCSSPAEVESFPLLPRIWADLVTCFGQLNMMEATLDDFQSSDLKRPCSFHPHPFGTLPWDYDGRRLGSPPGGWEERAEAPGWLPAPMPGTWVRASWITWLSWLSSSGFSASALWIFGSWVL